MVANVAGFSPSRKVQAAFVGSFIAGHHSRGKQQTMAADVIATGRSVHRPRCAHLPARMRTCRTRLVGADDCRPRHKAGAVGFDATFDAQREVLGEVDMQTHRSLRELLKNLEGV